MNAKEEFLRSVPLNEVKCAIVEYEPSLSWDEDEKHTAKLPCDFNDEDMAAFLKSLDFEYNPGFGTLELYGTIWLKSGNWLDREEYDGAEWWAYRRSPDIPSELLAIHRTNS